MHECFLWLYTHPSEAQVWLFWEHTGPNLPCVCFFSDSIQSVHALFYPSVLWKRTHSKPYCGISSFMPTLDVADQVLLKHKVNSHLSTFIPLEYRDCKYMMYVQVGHLPSPTGAPYLPFNPSITDQVTNPKHPQTPE